MENTDTRQYQNEDNQEWLDSRDVVKNACLQDFINSLLDIAENSPEPSLRVAACDIALNHYREDQNMSMAMKRQSKIDDHSMKLEKIMQEKLESASNIAFDGRVQKNIMTYVITEPCIGTKDAACVDVCPVDCIHSDDEDKMFYINPDECIDCGACEPVCPVTAIFNEYDILDEYQSYTEINKAWFENKEIARDLVEACIK